jgi:hypothetical protein
MESATELTKQSGFEYMQNTHGTPHKKGEHVAGTQNGMHVHKSESCKATGLIILTQYKERTFGSYKNFVKSIDERKKEDMGIE